MLIPYCNGKKALCYDEECPGHKCPYYDGTGGYYVEATSANSFNYDGKEESGLLTDD